MPERVATLVSVNVGMPRDVEWQGRTVHTGIWKHPVEGPCRVGRLNLEGDGQGDLAGHGGEIRAVYVYQLDSYRHWREHLGRDDFVFGQFGENFTVDGLGDDAFTTILELAEACDVPVRWSCRTGVCHTCETGLLDGTVAYDPDPLEPPGAGNVLVCCSRPGSNLAVDL